MSIINDFKEKSLKDSLTDMGYLFPCGGKGVCGKCRIKAPSLKATALDYRFFTSIEIENGIRLACDKEVCNNLEIECNLEKREAVKLESADILAVIDNNTLNLGIVNGRLIELHEFTLDKDYVQKLKALIGKNSIEFFEHYGVPKAETMLILSSYKDLEAFTLGKIPAGLETYGDYYEAKTFDMPSELVYFPPYGNKLLGSLNLLKISDIKDETLILLNDGLIIYKSPESIVINQFLMTNSCLNDIDEGILSLNVKAYLAAILYFKESFKPKAFCNLSNINNSALNAMLKTNDIIFEKAEVNNLIDKATALLTTPKFRTTINKLSKKAVLIDNLTDDDLWQTLFTEYNP